MAGLEKCQDCQNTTRNPKIGGREYLRQKPSQNMVLTCGNRIEPMVRQLASKAMAIFSMAAMRFKKLVF